MASSQSTVEFLMEQMSCAGDLRYRKMFGEYAIYCDDRVVALVCDDCLYVKITDIGREFVGTLEGSPPYPGAKPYFLIPGEKWDDREWLSECVRRTASVLPVVQPKPKKKKSP